MSPRQDLHRAIVTPDPAEHIPVVAQECGPGQPRSTYVGAVERKQWSDLSTRQKRAVYVVGAVETALTVLALIDLARRPSDDVRGPKGLWRTAAFVQPVGPVAYFLVGRR